MAELVAHAVSGGLSAFYSSSVLHPLEAVRTKLQALTEAQSIWQFIKELYSKEGLMGFYAGFSAQVLTNVVNYAIYFLLYRFFQRSYLADGRSLMGHLKVSILAGLGCTVFNTPMWVISNRLMKDGTQSIVQCVRSILKHEGVSGLWKGLAASFLLVSNPVINFVLYEFLKDRILSKSFKPSTASYFLLAALSKAIATFATYPLLTIRTRQQLSKDKALSPLQVIKELLRTDGVWGLYRGIHTKMVQTVLNTAVIMATHEKLAVALTRLLVTRVEIKLASAKAV
jgi:adenine nucleotide transporter 17